MRWTVRRLDRRVLVGHEALLGPDVLAVGRRPGGQEHDEVWVQRDEAVIAQLADGDAQPVGVADQGDGVGVELAELTGPHAGAGQHLDDQAITRETVRPSCLHQLGGILVVQELGQRIGPRRDVAVEDRVASWGVVPVPLDEALEEDADHAEPLALGVLGQVRAVRCRAGLANHTL